MALAAYKLKANAYIPKPVRVANIHDVLMHGNCWPHGEGTSE
jgi:hypothetical protein